jgi:hypothetical protein
MPPNQNDARRLGDLVIDPRETLEVELKGWLDIIGNGDHKANLAKALIALANHGGGFLILGFEQTDDGVQPSTNRPANLAGFTPDTVNSVVTGYAEPNFHCDVSIVSAPNGAQYPIISVPGGHRVPICAKRDGPSGQIVKRSSYYIRRPGSLSEAPQNAHEWDTLIRRCLTNSRDDLVNQIRTIIAGGPPTPEPVAPIVAVEHWLDDSLQRWSDVSRDLPTSHAARFPHGHFAVAYQLVGNLEVPTGAALTRAIDRGTIRHTGWPEFWVPSRSDIGPYSHNGNIECWMARDGSAPNPDNADFWRVSPVPQFFLVRGHQEDGASDRGLLPGTAFEITLPTWRVGEALLHASGMAGQFGDPSAQVLFFGEWSGLRGRYLSTSFNPNRHLSGRYTSQQDRYRGHLIVQADQIADSLPELVTRLVKPLYELFDFFALPSRLVPEELGRMRSNTF